MKVFISNKQNKVSVTCKMRELIKTAVRESLDCFGLRNDIEISVMLTDNKGIRKLNNIHRGIDDATDVLSFPMFEYDEKGNIHEDYAEFNEMGDIVLGDIVISLERAVEQADEYGHSAEREVGFLTVHSMLHLLGYDHVSPEEEDEMFGYQREILDKMGLKR